MKKTLEQLRAKPDHIKNLIALVGTVLIFTVIASVWLSSWDARMNAKESQEKAVSPLAGIASMLSGLTADIKSSYSNVPSYEDIQKGATTTASSTQPANVFDVSGVVIIDTPSK